MCIADFRRNLQLVATSLNVFDALLVVHVASGGHVLVGVAVLAVVELLAHHVVQAATAEVQDGLKETRKK